MQDVAAVLEDKISDGGDDAFAVRTGDEKDGSVLHGVFETFSHEHVFHAGPAHFVKSTLNLSRSACSAGSRCPGDSRRDVGPTSSHLSKFHVRHSRLTRRLILPLDVYPSRTNTSSEWGCGSVPNRAMDAW